MTTQYPGPTFLRHSMNRFQFGEEQELIIKEAYEAKENVILAAENGNVVCL